MKYRRNWDGDEWQSFALQLVHLRHGPENVQCVPDHVQGDAGLEFFFLGGTLYQCYAPEETSDIKKAATAQKVKARDDLKKLKVYKEKLQPILDGLSFNRWILLCPFLDDKAVVASARRHGLEAKTHGLPYLADDFEALVHSQEDFSAEIDFLRQQGAMPMTAPKIDTAIDISAAQASTLGQTITEKLNRGFKSSLTPGQIDARRDTYISYHLHRENALADLKLNHPALWDRSIQTLTAEEARLAAVGATSELPGEQLKESVDRLEKALADDLPKMAGSFATTVAIGTVGEWLMRCPLDFPGDDG